MISLQFDSVYECSDINSKVEVLSAYFYNPEIIIRKEKVWHFSSDEPVTIDAVYSKNGKYIGSLDFLRNATFLTELKDIQATDDNHTTCCIGFNSNENSWYGWSHRAYASFKIGSSVKRGDCAYTPVSLDDEIIWAIEFFDLTGELFELDSEHSVESLRNTTYKCQHTSTDVLENEYVLNYIFTRFNSSGEIFELENKSVSRPIPESYGRGEWTAETLEDAKQMAIDYARSVS